MKALRVVLVIVGIYALIHGTVQSFRHVFVLLIEPRTSVLDRYDPNRQDIAAAKSLNELVALYDAADKKVKAWEVGKTAQQLSDVNEWADEPHSSRESARQAIETWEGHDRQIRELHFFWWAGLACLVTGLGCYYRANRWLGAGFFIVAFGEMIYWTSPAIRVWSSSDEFERLVLWKLLYSTATLALLLAMWLRVGIPLLATNDARPPEKLA